MTNTAASTYNVKTAHGTVHRMTDGRVSTLHGMKRANKSSSQCGKADCGALTSSAASLTAEPVNCRKCGPA